MEYLLEKLGVNKTDTKIYIFLVEVGWCSVAQIARDINLPRQTVYSGLKQLLSIGIVEQSRTKKSGLFYADPQILISTINKHNIELERAKSTLEKNLPEILLQKKRYTQSYPTITYYEGEKSLQRLFDDILSQFKTKKDTVFRGFGVNTVKDKLSGYAEKFIKERAKYDVETRLIIGLGPDDFGISGADPLGREVKRIPIPSQDAGVYMVANRLYIFSYKNKNGIMIEDESVVKFLREVFDYLWQGMNSR